MKEMILVTPQEDTSVVLGVDCVASNSGGGEWSSIAAVGGEV